MLSSLRSLPQKVREVTLLGQLRFTDPQAFQIIRRVKADRLTYLDVAALRDLYRATERIEIEKRPGVIVEAGVALGGSSLVIATAKQPERPFYMYDAFGMIPAPSSQDGTDAHSRYQEISSGSARGIRGETYYGYQNDLYSQVQQSIENAGFSPDRDHIHMVRGFYENSLFPEQPVALAHLDCDWYDSVKLCLQRIEPLLVPGGILIVDDYEHWSGCRKAVDEYFAERRSDYHFVLTSRLHIIRR